MKLKANFRISYLRVLMLCVALLSFHYGQSQTKKDYRIVIEDGVDLGAVSSTSNPDETVTISTAIPSFTTGLYSVILICDGEIQESQTLIKN